MKIVTFLLCAMFFALSPYAAFAGIKDKKAIKASEKTISEAVETVKSACGNAELDATIDWSGWDNYDYKKMRSKKHDVLQYTGGLAESVLNEMAALCKDEDYKEELAKITNLQFAGKEDQESRYVEITLNGETLSVMLNADGVTSWKTEKVLKAVWE